VEAETTWAVSVVMGPRRQAKAEALWQDVAARPDRVLPVRITTDESRVYEGAVLNTDGVAHVVPRTGTPGRPRTPRLLPPRERLEAMVHTVRRKGRVVTVMSRRVCGPARQVARALARSAVSTQVHTSVVERFNATVRQHNSRTARTVETFSNAIEPHVAMSWFAVASDNVCRPPLGLRLQEEGRWRVRTPAMAAGITDHAWPIRACMHDPLLHQSLVSVPDQ
jgi:IS1 family transposase